MKTPDHHTSKLGSKDFVFQVNKWPFSITCNPLLPTITETFIDLALVKDMKITMKKVDCRNISYGGLSTKLVGSISQTVQVVHNGVPNGTMHLKAKVIRNLTNLYGIDCVAGQKLYKILTCDNAAASDNFNDSVATSQSSSEHAASDADEHENDVNASLDISADDLIFNNDDSPKTRKRKRKDRFMIANISFSSSMISSPPTSPRSSSPAAESSQVQSSHANLTSSSPGRSPIGQTRQESPPPQSQNPSQHLTNSILCGDCPPCSCVDALRAQQQQLLPAHYPVYLPVKHQPCGLACATHRAHVDNLHPPDPNICVCNPPRLQLGYAPVHLQYLPLLPAQDDHDDEPPLPPDFQPCGIYCGYEICQCLRNYEGRDWAS